MYFRFNQNLFYSTFKVIMIPILLSFVVYILNKVILFINKFIENTNEHDYVGTVIKVLFK